MRGINPILFQSVVTYLRTDKIVVPRSHCDTEVQAELDFFQLRPRLKKTIDAWTHDRSEVVLVVTQTTEEGYVILEDDHRLWRKGPWSDELVGNFC